MFDSLARLANGKARRVALFAFAFFVLAGALGGGVANRLDPYGADDPATETVKAMDRLEEAGLRVPAVVAVVEDAPVATPATRRRVEALENEVRERGDVASVSGYYDTRSPAFVSRDGDSTYFAVALKTTDDKQAQETGADIADQLSTHEGVVVGGPAVAQEQVNKQVEKDLQKAEMLAFPLLFLLSLLFFRSLVASVLPLMIGGLAIVGTFLILRVASEFASISIFALNLTTALGLGLAIDYSLFVVSRYREEIAKSGPGLEAMRRVLATAGRTVFFSSLTVAAALASLLVFPQRFLYSMGLGGALVALFAALISLTVLPAVLTLLGNRVNAGAPKFLQHRAEADARPAQEGFWYRLSRFVMRRPIPVATASALILIVLGLPFLAIKFNVVDPTVLPESASARQAYDTVSEQFPPYHETPIWIDLEGGGPKAAAQLTSEVEKVAGVAEVLPPQRLASGVTALQAISANPFASEASKETVKAIRGLPEPAGASVLVGGASADFVDFQASLSDHLPYALAIVIASTLVILFLMTGSVILPIKSLIMNFLNLSAVFGALVLIFQDGRLEGFLDYTSPGAIEQTMPILMFAVAFGLSTDYAVFLLSRIKEARDNGASDSESVAMGLERTGRIVTAAALLFAVAMAAFATSQIIFMTLVDRLRDTVVPGSALAQRAEVDVGGETARSHDVRDQIGGSMWKIILFVLALSFLVLMVMLRSLILPLKAVLMNLLSIGAAFGVLVAIFQWGWLDGFLGFESQGALDTINVPLIFAVVFGLSMDYEVFLMSRIRERYMAHGDNERAVAEGLSSSARTISSAALIMSAVFAVFVLTGVPSIKELGLGCAVAIALDATLVRLILVPAAMKLMGRWNWWMPSWLDRALPDLSFEGASEEPEPAKA